MSTTPFPTTDVTIGHHLQKSLIERTTLDAKLVETVLIQNDLSKLTPEQRVSYYNAVCSSLGLNPLTQPFAYITLNGKLRLYALKDATEQLRKIHGVSITEVTSQRLEDVFVVTAKALDKTGRTDAATGAVPIGNLKGEALANALMKAETKAKRRATLSICGLGMLDETEAEAIQQPLVVGALRRIELPVGTYQILSVSSTDWGGDVTFATWDGEEVTHKTNERECVSLCEQIAQDGVPVTLELQPITRGKNKGQVKLVGVHRFQGPAPDPVAAENASIDAELAKEEDLPL